MLGSPRDKSCHTRVGSATNPSFLSPRDSDKGLKKGRRGSARKGLSIHSQILFYMLSRLPLALITSARARRLAKLDIIAWVSAEQFWE